MIENFGQGFSGERSFRKGGIEVLTDFRLPHWSGEFLWLIQAAEASYGVLHHVHIHGGEREA